MYPTGASVAGSGGYSGSDLGDKAIVVLIGRMQLASLSSFAQPALLPNTRIMTFARSAKVIVARIASIEILACIFEYGSFVSSL